MMARWKEFAGMILIGDGLLNMLQPRRHTTIWNCGPKFYKDAARKLQANPGMARALGVAFLGLGLWLGRSAAKT